MYIYSFSVTYIDKIAITCISYIISILKEIKSYKFFIQKTKTSNNKKNCITKFTSKFKVKQLAE